jgi:hypothetical protein
MSNSTAHLAARRAQLIEQCAQQRESVAQDLAVLRSPFSLDGLRARLGANKKLLLAVAGVALGVVATRPKRLLALAARGLSLLQVVRKVLPLLPR